MARREPALRGEGGWRCVGHLHSLVSRQRIAALIHVHGDYAFTNLQLPTVGFHLADDHAEPAAQRVD
jgi:hypothetical protein